ncbi:MAG: hypothetical protein QOE86_4155 [Solirubrobacteraceae bacterium]|jgi:coenzyme F420 biosynthesis associated uncharacterized protein|nr:hypothetical protein [Solirubrobacteraceae bacterium]
MVDWRLANTVAKAVASTTPVPDGGYEAITAEVDAFGAESAQLVAGYTGLDGGDALPSPETVDRSEWAATNLRSMRSVLEPVADRVGTDLGPVAGPLRALTGTLLAVEVGALSGFLAARVLGQYEFPILDPSAPARLLMVGPNLAGAARGMQTDDRTLARWVALHETTHALQFSGVPWLREHMASRIRDLVSTLDVDVDLRKVLRLPGADDLRALVDAVRNGEVIQLVAGRERRAQLDEIQATMALIEGYAEHVMDAVGEQVLPDLGALREGLERRRRERSGLFRLLEKLIGLDMKLRQYEHGKQFCDAVVAEAGIAGLNLAWARPENLPTLAELDQPTGWFERVSGGTNARS